MNLKDKKKVILDTMDHLKKRLETIPKGTKDLGAVLMIAADPGDGDRVMVTGDAVGDLEAVRGAIVHALSDHAARTFAERGRSIAQTISDFQKIFRSDGFTGNAMAVLKNLERLAGRRADEEVVWDELETE